MSDYEIKEDKILNKKLNSFSSATDIKSRSMAMIDNIMNKSLDTMIYRM